uniref:Tectonic domain-containing protein n=1 Tax=Wuchereria bancrofti TaxID=6293 RepID=A0AAF5PLD3_WUCBA
MLENVGSTKATLFRRVNHFRKYLPSTLTIISSPKEEIVELWDDEKVTPFEYPATIFSDQCTGTAPLSLSKNISMTCLPQWNMFDEKHCISLKYLNVSYYLRKYSTKKDGNRTIVSIESIPEKSHLVRWLYWNGTACINAVSMVLIKFITHNGLLEDISASVHYTNITKQSYSQQFYQFDAVFIEISSTSNAVGLAKSLGYYMGQIIRIESSNNKTFLIPSGMECDMRKRQVNIRFGIQINTACRLRITTCTQILAQIQYLLDEWNGVTVYSFPYGTNDTVAMQNDRLSSSKMKWMKVVN